MRYSINNIFSRILAGQHLFVVQTTCKRAIICILIRRGQKFSFASQISHRAMQTAVDEKTDRSLSVADLFMKIICFIGVFTIIKTL